MKVAETKFQALAREKVRDYGHRQKMNHALRQSDQAFEIGKQQFDDLPAAKALAHHVKRDTIERLDHYLQQFEAQFTRHGGRVIWAENADQALAEIDRICRAKGATTVVKSKSMVTEEIQLNTFLTDQGVDVVETDLGEYIQQLSGEPPYHIIAPSIHKSKEDVAKLFHEKLHVPDGLSPKELARVAREKLRVKFKQAEVGITGANFLIADIGGVAITENEGNARLATALPGTHIVITGIEKVLPSLHDLHLFWPLLATHGTGQKLTVYNSVFTGPRKGNEVDGPTEMYVILLDNGRTELLADPKAREALYCIRCGACLNGCPVYKNIGGHAYATTYSGPIGAVISPYLQGMAENKHLSYASSLCGKCTEVCPVKINLHELLLNNRRIAVEKRYNPRLEKVGFYLWRRAMLSRDLMDMGGYKLKNTILSYVLKSSWGDDRELPTFKKSFSQQWCEMRGK